MAQQNINVGASGNDGTGDDLRTAGTKINNNMIVSNGGRVLNIVTRSNDFKSARENSLEILKEINWDNGFYRKDIGYKVIKE